MGNFIEHALIASGRRINPIFVFHKSVLKLGPKRFLAAGSTVPYAGTLFGLYFACRCNFLSSHLRLAFNDRDDRHI